MKRILLFAAFVGLLVSIYFLYQRQLGAIAFFLLSIFFFFLAVNQLSKKTEQGISKSKK